MGKEYSIIVVHNSTRRVPDAEVTYTVRLTSVQDSKSIRLKFGSFFLGGAGNDRRPEGLKGISIKNRVTPNTKTRIAIMKLLASRYRDSNPGSKVKMIGYEPRPMLKITPIFNQTSSEAQKKVVVKRLFNQTPETICHKVIFYLQSSQQQTVLIIGKFLISHVCLHQPL